MGSLAGLSFCHRREYPIKLEYSVTCLQQLLFQIPWVTVIDRGGRGEYVTLLVENELGAGGRGRSLL